MVVCEICHIPKNTMEINTTLVCDRCNKGFHLVLSKAQRRFLECLFKELIGAQFGKTTMKHRADLDNIEQMLEMLNHDE